MRRRRRFADVIDRQLDLFEREQAGLIREVKAALEEDAAEEYENAFNRSVLRRFPRFALEIEDT